MRIRIEVSSDDRVWWERTSFRDPASILRFSPRDVAALSQSSETFAVRVAEVMRDDPSGASQECGSPQSSPDAVFVKRYRYRTFTGRLQGAFRGTFFGRSRARFEYETLNAIRARGIAAVRPIAYVEFRKRGFVRACVLITEAEPDAQPLERLLRRRGGADAMDRAARRRRLEQLAAFVSAMHEAGVAHGALLGRNILVGDTFSAAPGFVLLDPNPRGSVSVASATQVGRISDLTDLAATALPFTTRTERARFLRVYLGRGRFAEADRPMIAEIEGGAVRLSPTEQHRQTIATAILWLQERIRNRGVSRAEEWPRRFTSLAEFVAAIDGAPRPRSGSTAEAEDGITSGKEASGKTPHNRARTIEIRLDDRRVAFVEIPSETDASAVCRCSVSSGLDSAPVSHVAAADLQIACDEPTFLAAINGEVEALERARRGCIDLRGDAALLDILGSLADAPCEPAAHPSRIAVPLPFFP